VRIAIIGCGSIGSRHARTLTALGHEVCLYDVDVPKMTKLARSVHGHCGIGDPASLDGLMICTPASTHVAVARGCLDLGYAGPLFVEKPLASLAGACAIFRSWLHPTVQVGYNWRYNRELETFRRMLPTQRSVHFVCTTELGTWPGQDYAAPLLECSHELDLACQWDPTLQLVGSGTRGSSGAWLQLLGDAGDVLIDLDWHAPGDRWVTAQHQDGARVPTLCHPSPASVIQSYFDELRAWIWCIEHQEAPAAWGSHPVDDAIAVLAIVEQAQRGLSYPTDQAEIDLLVSAFRHFNPSSMMKT